MTAGRVAALVCLCLGGSLGSAARVSAQVGAGALTGDPQ